MQATKHSKSSKAFSVFVAFALALLMVPIVPGSVQTAVAEEGDASWAVVETKVSTGLVTYMLYNNHPDPSNSDLATDGNPKIGMDIKADKVKSDIASAKTAVGEEMFATPTLEDLKKAVSDKVQSAAEDDVIGAASNAVAQEALDDINNAWTTDDAKNDALDALTKTWALEGDNWKTNSGEDKAKQAVKNELTKSGGALEGKTEGTDYKDLVITVAPKDDSGASFVRSGGDIAAVDPTVVPDTPSVKTAVIPENDNLNGFTYDAEAGYELTGVSSTQDEIVEITKTENGYAIQAKRAGVAGVTYKYTYAPTVKEFPYEYTATYDYKCDTYRLSDWTYSRAFTYTYHYTPIEDGVDQSATEESESADVTVLGLKGDPVQGDNPVADDDKKGDLSFTGDYAKSATIDPIRVYSELNGGTHTFDNAITVENLFPDDFGTSKDLVDDSALVYRGDSGSSDAFVGADFKNKLKALEQLGDPQLSYDSALVDVSYENGVFTVKPVAATRADGSVEASPVTVTATFTLKDSTPVTQTFKVTVKPETIDLSQEAIAEDFRLQADEELKFVEDANALVAKAVGDSYSELGTYYTGIATEGYDWQGVKNTFELADGTLSWTADKDTFKNFDIIDPSAVLVQAMERVAEWPEGLKLAATYGTGVGTPVTFENAADAQRWVKSTPVASWDDDHLLAYASVDVPTERGGFSSQQQLSGGDGTHNVSMFVFDCTDDTVYEVSGISYKLDRNAPALSGSSVTRGKTSEGGFLSDGNFFARDNIHVSIPIKDEYVLGAQNNVNGKDGVAEGWASGIVLDGTVIEYDDIESGAHHKLASSGEAWAVSKSTPTEESDKLVTYAVYDFDIDADANGGREVPTSSISVYAYDEAGNELSTTADDNAGIPVDISNLIADGVAPTVETWWDNNDVRNGSYYGGNRSLHVRITDDFFEYTKRYAPQTVVTIKGDGATNVALTLNDFESAGNNTWTAQVDLTSEELFNVAYATLHDAVGRAANTPASESFTIDKNDPHMEVSFDNNNASNGNYYNAPRTATITIDEHNFNGSLVNVTPTSGAGNGDSVGAPQVSDWSSNGDIHTATVHFPGEGVYSLSISGTDLTNRPLQSYSESEFIIDTTMPQIEISGVDNRQAYAGSAQPGVTVQDTNISDATTIELSKISYPMSDNDANPYSESRSNATTEITASYPDADQIASNDGVYTLTVHAVDMAGNTADQAVTWSVNRFGSTYVLSDTTTKMLNTYLNPSKVSDVVVTEINPSGLDESATAVELTHDTSNSTLKLGSDYGITASDSSGWSEYTYNVQKSNFASDGSYRVLFHSEDVASNTSENTMKNKNASRTATAEVAFAVDDTPPIVTFIDLDANGLYEESTHTAQVSIEDNLKLDTAEVKIDGEKVLALDSAELSKSATHSFDVPESASTHEIVVTAYDAAGNAETVTATNVTVTTDPVKLWMNNTPLFVGTIVGGIVVVGAVIAFFVTRGRRTSL